MISSEPYRFTASGIKSSSQSNHRCDAWRFRLLILIVSLLLPGCAATTAYEPAADQNLPMKLGRIQSYEKSNVRVEVSIPTDEEGSQFPALPLCLQMPVYAVNDRMQLNSPFFIASNSDIYDISIDTSEQFFRGAEAADLPLFHYLGGPNAVRFPVPNMNILNGGVHAHW